MAQINEHSLLKVCIMNMDYMSKKIWSTKSVNCFKQKTFAHIAVDKSFKCFISIVWKIILIFYLACKSSRICLTKLRIYANKLKIESGSYDRNRLESQERLYQVCDINEIEDEYHLYLNVNRTKNFNLCLKCKSVY
jgi:hypothetical protein